MTVNQANVINANDKALDNVSFVNFGEQKDVRLSEDFALAA
jgi:hypothetical protein